MQHSKGRFTPSPSMAVALAALFVALGGTGYAAMVAANSVNSNSIVNGSVKKIDIANGAISNAKLASNSVNSAKVADGSLGAADLSSAAKTTIRGTKWALVSGSGVVVKSSGGITASGSTGEYNIDFGTPTSGHLMLASISQRDNQAVGYTIKVAPCGLPAGATSDTWTNCATAGAANSAHVYIRNEGGAAANQSFYVALMP